MVRFSIIIPVYKVEKYLSACVDSVLKQSWTEYELILVDDGSPDQCGAICDAYAEKSERIKVIHKENGGLSSARNAGLDAAQGEYIVFIDSDDFWTDPNALENIDRQLHESNADVLIFPLRRYYEDGDQYTDTLSIEVQRKLICDVDKNDAVRYMLTNNIFRAAAWNKVVRRALIENNQMRFLSGRLSEDMDWCGNLLLYANRFDFYDSAFYAYRQQRSGSITQGKTTKLVEDKLFMCRKGLEQAMTLTDMVEKELLAGYYAYEFAVLIGVSSGIRDKQILREMRELCVLLQYDVCRKVAAVNRLMKLAGFRLTRTLLCTFMKLKK